MEPDACALRPGEFPQVRKQGHVAVPGVDVPVRAVRHGPSVRFKNFDRHRLDGGRGSRCRVPEQDVEQARFERQDGGAIRRRAFGEDGHVPAAGEKGGQVPVAIGRVGAGTADEDGLLQFCKEAEQGPRRNVGLGDERGVEDGGKDGNVEIGNMVAGEQGLLSGGGTPRDLDPESEQAAHAAGPETAQGIDGAAAGKKRDDGNLQREEEGRPRGEGGESEKGFRGHGLYSPASVRNPSPNSAAALPVAEAPGRARPSLRS